MTKIYLIKKYSNICVKTDSSFYLYNKYKIDKNIMMYMQLLIYPKLAIHTKDIIYFILNCLCLKLLYTL